MANTKWFWMWYYDVKYNNTNYVPSKIYDSNVLPNWKYLSTSTLGDNSSNKGQGSYAYIRIGYYWDSVDKVNRTAKIHTRLELVEFQNYVCINNQSLLQLGMNIVNHTTMNKNKIKGIIEYKPYLMNVTGYTYANRGNPFYDNYITYTPYGSPYPYGVIGTNSGSFYNNYGGKSRYIANHVIILDQQEATIPYNASGVASATINYDILFGYQIISSGNKFNASGKGSFVVKDAPKIPSIVTGLSISNKSAMVTPKSMNLTGLTDGATEYTLNVTSTKSATKTFGATITGYNSSQNTYTFSVTPSDGGCDVIVTSNNTDVVSINSPTIDITNSSNRKFTVTCKKPGTAKITIKTVKNTNGGYERTATMNCNVSANDTITWSSSNKTAVTVDNGKVTALAGHSGKAIITAACKGNSSVSKKLTINSILDASTVTGLSLNKTSETVTIQPKTMVLTGLDNDSTKYTMEVTETQSKSRTFGAKVTAYAEKTVEQQFNVTPATNVEGTVLVTSSDNSVITINTPSVDIKNSNNRKFKYTCKKPGSATITLACNGKTAKITVKVTSDDTFTWSSNNSKIVSVSNGKVTANEGYNGTATITAKSKGNTALTKTLSITLLLRPFSYTIASDKDIDPIYPGETVKFKVMVNPMFSDTSKSVATEFKGVDWTVANNEANGGGTIERKDVLAEGTNKSGDFEVSYKLKTTDNTKDYIIFDVSPYYGINTEDWNYFLNLRTYLKVFIDKPKIQFDKDNLIVAYGSTNKVKVITTPANGKFSLSYDKTKIEVTTSDNTLTVKGLKSGTAQITATGEMPIMPYMSKPIAVLPINVGNTELKTISAKASATYNLGYESIVIGVLDHNNIVKISETSVFSDDYFNVTTFLKLKQLEKETLDISFTPKQCNDTLVVKSDNTNVLQIAEGSSRINLVDKNGKVSINFQCINSGKANIILSSLLAPSVFTKIAVTVEADKTVKLSPEVAKFVPEINLINGPTYISSCNAYKSEFKLKSGSYDGKTKLTAYPTKNKNIKDSIIVGVKLTPTNLDLYIKQYNGSNVVSDDPNDKYCRTVSAFVNDKITLNMLLLPNNVSDTSKQVNVNFRTVNYTYYADDKKLSDTVVNQLGLKTTNRDNLVDEFDFTVPTIKAESFKIEAVPYNFYNTDLKASVTINIAQPGLYIKDYENKDTINVYLANEPNKSFRELTVVTTPPNQNYITSPDISNRSADRGYYLTKNSKNKNILKINPTNIRNLNKTSKKTSVTAKEAVYTNGQPNKNINGYTFQVIYDGPIQTNRTCPVVSVNVYNLNYFGEPYIENLQWNSSAKTYELHYYGDRPKIILALPNYNDFDILDDIEIEFSNIKYSFKKNPKLFSIYYNGNTKNHSIISSAIVDYKTLGDIHSCVFSPDKNVTNGNVIVTYRTTKFSTTIQSASTKFKLVKKSLPTLPNVGDPIRLSDMQQYLNAVADVIGFTGVTYDSIETFGLNLASLNSIGSNEKNKESSISAMPFLKLLLILNRWLDVYKQFATYTNGNGIVTPSNLSFEPVRNMFVKRSIKEKWYANKGSTEDPFFFETYKKLTGQEFLDENFPEIDYPIMVDDSNDFVGDESYGFTNKFKATSYYEKFTISPLTEIIKALKQL